MFIRFVIARQHEDSHSLLGIFQAAYQLRDAGDLEAHEEEWLKRELAWLKKHLKSPDCLRDAGTERAISWFNPTAKRAIEKVRGIAALLEENGIHVRMLKTRDPGTIIYEDKWQVVAYPPRGKWRAN